MSGLNLVNHVTTDKAYNWKKSCPVEFDQRKKDGDKKPYKVVAIDFGIKRSILQRLIAHGCEVTVLPANTDFQTVMGLKPEGVFLSNGPGDPSAVLEGIALVKNLIKKETKKSFQVIITGGFSELFKNSIKIKTKQNFDITINGLIKASKLIR